MLSLRLTLTSLAAALFLSTVALSPAVADDDDDRHNVRIIGQVTEINTTNNTITLKTAEGVSTIGVTGFTDFELESQTGPFEHDRDVTFSELKMGDWVKVKAEPSQTGKTLIADDVDIRR